MSKNLLAGERPLRTARQHWSVFVPVGMLTLLVWVAGGVMLVVLPGSVGGRDIGRIKLFAGLLLVVIMLGALLVNYLRWRFTTYMLTDKRIIVSRGILSRYMESISLDRVQNISTTQGLLGRILHRGNVEIESAGRDGSEVLACIYDPVGFTRDVEGAAEAHRTGQVYGGSPAPPGSAPPGYAPPGGQGGYVPPSGYGPPPRGGGV